MPPVDCVAASASVSAGALPDWAQNSHAAMQRVEFESRSKSSRSTDAKASYFSAGWLDVYTFSGWKRLFGKIGLKGGPEPILTDAAMGTHVSFVKMYNRSIPECEPGRVPI